MTGVSEKQRAWVVAQIETRRPAPTLVPGVSGGSVADLAVALATLEGGRGQLFGLQLGRAELEELRPLSGPIRTALEQWRARLTELHGAEGDAMVVTIAARRGVTLAGARSSAHEAAGSSPPDERGQAALAALTAAVSDPAALTEAWREAGELFEDDEVVSVHTGEPDPEFFRLFAARHEAAHGQPLPRFYVRLLSRYNGIAIAPSAPDEDEAGTVPPADLGEPALWPIDVYGDHTGIDADLEGIGEPFTFGEIADSGYLVFDASAVAVDPEDAPVFWVPRNFSSESPTRLADSIAGFVKAWAAAHLSVQEVLRRAGVPGWGG